MLKQLLFHCREDLIMINLLMNDTLHKESCKQTHERIVLIIFTPFIGDTILYLNVLRELANYYHSQGKRCNIITLKQNKSIIEQYCEYDEIYIYDYNRYILEKKYRKEFYGKVRGVLYEKVINPYYDNLLDADIIAMSSRGKEKIVADRNKIYPGRILNRSILKNRLRKQAYNKVVVSAPDRMDYIKQSYFMKKLGISSFRASISYMKPMVELKNIPNSKYCIVAPGASKSGKRWEPEKFATIINNLVHNYDLDIYVCGSKGESDIYQEVLQNIDLDVKEKVIDFMGKTSLLEYLELIRKAEIVISNDSSPVHMSAAVGTPCVYIIGGWDYHRLLPYEVEKENEDTIPPVAIYSDKMKCFNCFDHYVGYQNKKCRQCVKEGKPYPCISSINVSKVEKEINHILNR